MSETIKIHTMFGSCLPPVVCWRVHVLFMLFICLHIFLTKCDFYLFFFLFFCIVLSNEKIIMWINYILWFLLIILLIVGVLIDNKTCVCLFCIVLCFSFVCLRLVSLLPVSLDCPFFLPLRYSLMLISS